MRLHRFFIASSIHKGTVNSFESVALAHQLRSVFRFHEGSELIFFNGSGTDYVSVIVSLSKDTVMFRVQETRDVKPFSDIKLSLVFSLIKKDNTEWIIEKGTELGVSVFVPLVSERSEKKGFNEERAERISIEASEQSGRAEVPKIEKQKSLADYLSSTHIESGRLIVFHTEGMSFDRVSLPKSGEIVACVGPEGGWSPNEIALFQEKGATIVKLSMPVLRAETAAIAVSAIILS